MQRRILVSMVSLGLLGAFACAEEGSGRGDGEETGIGDGDGDGDGGGDGDGDGDGSGDGDGDGDGTGDGDGDGDGEHKWDLGTIPDAGGDPCADGGGGGGDDPTFSYLWAANSSQGTISKIDTELVTEVGRFLTDPGGAGNPSRTSVSASGNVAVGNRNSGVAKFYANIEDCEESNGIPGIQTSQDATWLDWDQEECRAWHNPYTYYTQRPVAWTKGTFNEGTCEYENEKLWTSGIYQSGGEPEVLLLNGDTGATEASVQLQGWGGDSWGIYGGAVDAAGNFWGSQLGSGSTLIKVNIDDMSYQMWTAPVGPHWYGMTVDSDGYVWLCSATVGRFDPQTETWEQATVGGYAGCMSEAGEDGLLWVSASNAVIGVNRQTLAVEHNWPLSFTPRGISIDFHGYVWGVQSLGSAAGRVDPDTGVEQTYQGLVGCYTYSDMTGYALEHAGATPDG